MFLSFYTRQMSTFNCRAMDSCRLSPLLPFFPSLSIQEQIQSVLYTLYLCVTKIPLDHPKTSLLTEALDPGDCVAGPAGNTSSSVAAVARCSRPHELRKAAWLGWREEFAPSCLDFVHSQDDSAGQGGYVKG